MDKRSSDTQTLTHIQPPPLRSDFPAKPPKMYRSSGGRHYLHEVPLPSLEVLSPIMPDGVGTYWALRMQPLFCTRPNHQGFQPLLLHQVANGDGSLLQHGHYLHEIVEVCGLVLGLCLYSRHMHTNLSVDCHTSTTSHCNQYGTHTAKCRSL